MIKRHFFIITLTTIFLLLSGVTYFVHYLIFRDAHHIYLYLVGDLAFLPLQVLLVGLIIERILTRREKQAKLQKLNMVVGAFFSEIGNYLLHSLLEHFRNKDEISQRLRITAAWTKKDFQKAADFAYHLPVDVDARSLDLSQLRGFPFPKERVSFDIVGESQSARGRPFYRFALGTYAR